MSTWKFVFAGVGGQGMITAGIILGEAAVIHEGRYAVQTQSYGAEARGGLSRADVTVSDQETYYPKVEQAHCLVCMHQAAYTGNIAGIRPGGILIVDADHVAVGRHVDARRFSLPLTALVRDATGNPRGANLAALGAVVALTGAVGVEAVRAAIRARFGRDSSNETAYDLGLQAAEQHASGTRSATV
jgi:2-oxoglutarate ferredoxin oxidoreductase subunit gamma